MASVGRGVLQTYELRIAIQYNKMVGQPAKQHKSTNNTTQHIYTTTYKNYPGFTLVVTVYFQRITFHSSILKCKPNYLFTTSNMPLEDLVCANADATTGISWLWLARILISLLTGERLLLWHSVVSSAYLARPLLSCKKD